METLKIMIFIIAGTIVAGIVMGIFIGKMLVKRAKSVRRRLLSTKERIAYSSCVLLGAALILFGIFFKFPSPEYTSDDDMVIIDGGDTEDGGGPNISLRNGGVAVEAGRVMRMA